MINRHLQYICLGMLWDKRRMHRAGDQVIVALVWFQAILLLLCQGFAL